MKKTKDFPLEITTFNTVSNHDNTTKKLREEFNNFATGDIPKNKYWFINNSYFYEKILELTGKNL